MKLKKLFLIVPLVFSILFLSTNEASAAWHSGPTGTICSIKVWADATNYYQPGAGTVDFYAEKPSSTCGGDTMYYYVFIEKYVNGSWQHHKTVTSANGYFTTKTPTKLININQHFGSSGTYRLNLNIYANNDYWLGNVYSGSFRIHY